MTGVVGVALAASLRAPASSSGAHRSATRRPKDARGGTPQGGPRGFKWWQDEKVKADLRLSTEQSARIDEIFTASFTKMKDKVDDLNRREEQLSNLISGNDVTEAQLLSRPTRWKRSAVR